MIAPVRRSLLNLRPSLGILAACLCLSSWSHAADGEPGSEALEKKLGESIQETRSVQKTASSDDETESTSEMPSETNAEKPWAKGVSEEAQATALDKFQEGNQFFVDRQFEQALAHYEEALKHWAHPSIFFNVAVCEINLERPIAAQGHIKRSLEYGEEALGESLHSQALTYQKLIHDRLGYLKITTAHNNITLILDGDSLTPRDEPLTVLPGTHQLVAKKKGFVPYTRAIQVAPGIPTVVDVQMTTLSEATEYERPMAQWIPWAVTGGGVLVGLIGGGLTLLGESKRDEFQKLVTVECPDGCTLEGSVAEMIAIQSETERLDSQATTFTTAGLTTMAVGGAAILTGVSLLVWNTPRAVTPEDSGVAGRSPRFTPVIGRTVAGGQLDFRF